MLPSCSSRARRLVLSDAAYCKAGQGEPAGMCCRPASFQAPALPAWKPEEPDSPKVDHDLDGEILLQARCHCMPVSVSKWPSPM